MVSVPHEVVRRVEERFVQMSSAQAQELMQRMVREQPVVAAYLMAGGEGILSETERSSLILRGLQVWQIMEEAGGTPPKVTVGQVQDAQQSNLAMLRGLQANASGQMNDPVKAMILGHNQAAILRYVVGGLLQEVERKELADDKNLGLMVLCLKTVIDCFDQPSDAAPRPNP